LETAEVLLLLLEKIEAMDHRSSSSREEEEDMAVKILCNHNNTMIQIIHQSRKEDHQHLKNSRGPTLPSRRSSVALSY